MFFLKKNHIFFLDNLEFQDENINIVKIINQDNLSWLD